jgi:putative peptidoglycan lipid II flippase
MGLSVTMIISWSLQVIVQIPSLIKMKFRYKPNFHFKDRHIRSSILLAIPMLVSTWVQPLYTFVNARFASHMSGAYSSLEYANRLYLIVTGVFSFVVTNLIFPKLSRANAGDNREEADMLVMTSLKAVIMVIAPLMMGIIILSRPITAIIYEHGAFTNTVTVANALSSYAVGMIFLAANEILSKAFFSMKHSLTPMITSIISMIFNIVLVSCMYGFIKNDAYTLTGALALAAAFSSIVNALLNAIMLFRKRKGMFKKEDAVTIFKVIVASAVMSVAVKAIYNFIAGFSGSMAGNILVCAVCGVCGIVIYAIMLLLLKVSEITALISRRK